MSFCAQYWTASRDLRALDMEGYLSQYTSHLSSSSSSTRPSQARPYRTSSPRQQFVDMRRFLLPPPPASPAPRSSSASDMKKRGDRRAT